MFRFISICLFLQLPALAGSVLWLEPLVDKAAVHVAPPAIQKAMAAVLKADLTDCETQKHLTKQQVSKYFCSIPIDLGINPNKAFLVFPSKYCYAFFGAHSIAFWVVTTSDDILFKVRFSGRHDGLEILESKHNGLFDLRVHTLQGSALLYFDGSMYIPSEKQ